MIYIGEEGVHFTSPLVENAKSDFLESSGRTRVLLVDPFLSIWVNPTHGLIASSHNEISLTSTISFTREAKVHTQRDECTWDGKHAETNYT